MSLLTKLPNDLYLNVLDFVKPKCVYIKADTFLN